MQLQVFLTFLALAAAVPTLTDTERGQNGAGTNLAANPGNKQPGPKVTTGNDDPISDQLVPDPPTDSLIGTDPDPAAPSAEDSLAISARQDGNDAGSENGGASREAAANDGDSLQLPTPTDDGDEEEDGSVETRQRRAPLPQPTDEKSNPKPTDEKNNPKPTVADKRAPLPQPTDEKSNPKPTDEKSNPKPTVADKRAPLPQPTDGKSNPKPTDEKSNPKPTESG